jgi:hypothetical protein
MADKQLIGLEIHDTSLWEPLRVLPILRTMERWGYNALVLHQNDLLDECTQLGLSSNYGVSDLRLKKVRNRTAWMNKLTVELAKFDAQLFLEIKEPSFHDYVLEDHPELLGDDGEPDPTNSAWVDFCKCKTIDLLERVPNIGGMILNISSPESRVSMPDYVETRNGELDQEGWFDRLIGAFRGPLEDCGKAIYVRDFSYTKDLQSVVLAAIGRCDGKVGASIKITAHDYFPKSEENPALRQVEGETIVEFDSFGEHTAWGIIPNCRVAEYAERMHAYREIGASGMLVRTSWEAIAGANALDSLSAVNVFALPKLARSDVDADAIIMAWLKDEFEVEGETAKQVADLLQQSWHIPAAAYWHHQVFPRHSCLPSTWQEGWLSMETTGMGQRDHSVSIPADDARLSEEARKRLFEEKVTATALATRLAEEASVISNALPPKLKQLFETFEWLPVFAKQFELATKATFYTARASISDSQKIAVENFSDLSKFFRAPFLKGCENARTPTIKALALVTLAHTQTH